MFLTNQQWHRLIFSAVIAVLLLLFQNCVFTESGMQSYSGNSKSSRYQVSGGNGDSYEGKLVVTAPETQVPGVPVEIKVEGGEPPYNMSSSAASGEFIAISEGEFLFQIDSDETAPVIVITVTDSRGETASTEIMVLGLNRWFFDAPGDISYFTDGGVAFLDGDGKTAIGLSVAGESVFKQVFSSPQTALQAISDSKILLAGASGFLVFDWKTQSQTDLGSVPEGCVVEHLFDLGHQKIGFACTESGRPQVLDLATGLTSQHSVSFQGLADGARLIGMFPADSPGGTLLIFSDGNFLVINPSGQTVSQWKVQDLPDSEIQHREFVDSGKLVSGEFVLLSRFKRHIYILDGQGSIIRRLGARGTEDGSFAAVDHLAILNGEKIVVTDPDYAKVSFFDRYQWTHSFGANSSGLGAFNEPWDVRYAQNGDLYVLDKINKRIQIFDRRGKFLKVLDSRDGSLATGPWWSAEKFHLTDSGRVVLSNRARFLVHSFDPESGESVTVGDGTQGATESQFNQARGAAQLSDGRILVADTTNDRIQVFDRDGRYVQTLTEFEGAEVRLNDPHDIEVHPKTGDVYVLHNNDTELVVLHPDLTFKKLIYGKGDARFYRPANFSFDSVGNIHLIDSERNRVIVVSDRGEVERVIATPVGLNREMNQPKGSAVSPDGSRIAIADTENDRILIVPLK